MSEGFKVAMNWGNSHGAKGPGCFVIPLAMRWEAGASDKNARQSARPETADIQEGEGGSGWIGGVDAGEKSGSKAPPISYVS